jgi:hypothetical protein
VTLQNILVVVIGTTGLVWYYICLIGLGRAPLGAGATIPTFRQFMSLSLTTIGVSLATFVGMLLGVRSVEESTAQVAQMAATAAESAQQAQVGVAAAAELIRGANELQQVAQAALTTQLQWWAAGLYVVSLLLALAFWWRGGDNTDPAISNLGKSLLGLVGGALSIALNLPG